MQRGYDAFRAWYAIGLLTLLFAISIVDRFILALLAQPMSHDLGFNDTRLGALIGTGFAIVYSLAGVPIAHWIDRGNRPKIIALGALTWSCTTVASAFVSHFGSLIALRSGVAIGEAVLTPAAVSLIADMFPRERRWLPMSVFLSCGAVMGLGSFAVGGAAIDFATQAAHHVALAPWRLTLIIVGVPGAIIGLLIFATVREPGRHESQAQGAESSDIRSFIAYFRKYSSFYLPFLLGGGMYCLFGLSIVTWMPTILIRGYGYQPAQAGYAYGLVGVPSGLAGIFLWSRIARLIDRRRPSQGAALGLLLASAIGAPVFTATTRFNDGRLVLAGTALCTLIAAAWSILPPICIQTFGPNKMRARLMALNLLALNLIGFGLGPVLTVWCSRFWSGNPRALGYGLSAVGAFAAVSALACYLVCLRSIGRLEIQRT